MKNIDEAEVQDEPLKDGGDKLDWSRDPKGQKVDHAPGNFSPLDRLVEHGRHMGF